MPLYTLIGVMTEEWIIDESKLQYLEKLGAGVSGEVYHVTLKTEDGSTIDAAAKIFRENQESDNESQKKELNFLRMLKHPNIVEFFCAVLFPITIIVTEFAAKGSLYEYLKSQIRLPLHHMLEWARQSSSAVQYLHKQNVVHRDIKSKNFVITANDTLKLCDFGIAKTQYRTEKTNNERGTIPWMAPEAIVKLTSKASDIYSLGIVIWELLSCEIPYEGKEIFAILYAVKVHKLRPDIPPHCPPALKDMLKKCWKENRKKRPDIDEVLGTIENLVQKQHENDNAKFYNKRGKREIYHLHQRHLANENEQTPLTEHVIPVDNDITGSPFVDGFETERSFNINGNVSPAERGLEASSSPSASVINQGPTPTQSAENRRGLEASSPPSASVINQGPTPTQSAENRRDMKGRHIQFILTVVFLGLAVAALAALATALVMILLKENFKCRHVLDIDKSGGVMELDTSMLLRNNEDCPFTLQTSSNRHILLTAVRDCVDGIQIYNGPNLDISKVIRLNKESVLQGKYVRIISAKKSLTIRLKHDAAGSFSGFRFAYTSFRRGCDRDGLFANILDVYNNCTDGSDSKACGLEASSSPPASMITQGQPPIHYVENRKEHSECGRFLHIGESGGVNMESDRRLGNNGDCQVTLKTSLGRQILLMWVRGCAKIDDGVNVIHPKKRCSRPNSYPQRAFTGNSLTIILHADANGSYDFKFAYTSFSTGCDSNQLLANILDVYDNCEN